MHRSAGGREVDFVIRLAERILPVEVKYRSSISGYDREAVRRAFGSGLLLTRSETYLSGPVRAVPAALFLWLLNTDV